jgi:hypothetical protein
VLQAARPRKIDSDHLPYGRQSATSRRCAVALANLNMSARDHVVPFLSLKPESLPSSRCRRSTSGDGSLHHAMTLS